MSYREENGQVVKCIRCGDPALASSGGDSKARPFRRAKRGYCTPCAVCSFFQDEGDNGIGHVLPSEFDPEGLRLPHIQRQFAQILALGGSELAMADIDWNRVIEKWRLKNEFRGV
jgi:hypothetical protein